MMSVARQFSLEFLDDPAGHHALLHANPHGTVIVWERRATGNVWHKIDPAKAPDDVRAFLQGLSGRTDTYFTVNEFAGWRLTRLLKSLRALFVDLDIGRQCSRADLTGALDHLTQKAMPRPSLVVFSGRGMHFYWITKPTPPQALPVWQACERVLIESLADFHADKKAKDCTRVLRLSGTVNGKNGEEVRGVVLDGKPYSFRHLCDEVLGYRQLGKGRHAKVRSIEARQIRKGIHPKATIFRRWHLVLADLEKIGQHCGTIPEGFRNEFLFLCSVALSWFASPDSIKDEVLDFADRFCPDISVTEAVKAASASIDRARKAAGGVQAFWCGEEVDPRYRFKRQTLWEHMGDLAKPIQGKLRAIIPDDIAQERKQETWATRWDDHYTGEGYCQGNAEKVALARSMQVNGKTQIEIAKELGVSQPTICRWLS